MSTHVVSGSVATVTELGKDEAWLRDWLKEQPARLGLGELEATEGATDDECSFVATDADRCFSVEVQLGEMEASRGFGVLDNWARNRAQHPDKTHIAVLVTEAMPDRYETTLQALSEHLPLVVVELQAWKGENEAIVVPHVALSSDDVDLSGTPAAKAAAAVAKAAQAAATFEPESEAGPDTDDELESDEVTAAEAVSGFDAAQAEAEAELAAEDELAAAPENKDDTGVGNPWGLDDTSDERSYQADGTGSTGLLHKVG